MELIEEILSRDNMYQALERVKSNKGAPGIDGVTTEQLDDYLRKNWLACKEKILKGTYIPAPVKRVEIPKPSGGKRMLGIPIVLDRLIQQAILQKLTPIFDPEFSAHSYGFRPGRGAHDAVRQAKRNIEAGHEYVVDMDIEKFFDRVNHDILMSRVARKVKDKLVLKLIRAYLNSGVMIEGVCVRTEIGTPQGGPLSPLLANILLDDLDKELEKRGHRFCRYADDCNVYVKSPRAGERVLTGITEFLEKKLKLKINREKSGVGLVNQRKFLGFSFTLSRERGIRIVISPQSLKRLKGKIKRLTRSHWSISMEERTKQLNSYLNGWLGYYALADTVYPLRAIEQWIRRRLRKCQLKNWRLPRTKIRKLLGLGLSLEHAMQIAFSRKGGWRLSHTPQINRALNNNYWKSRGLMSLEERYSQIRQNWRIAVYGSVCTVV